MFLCFCFPLLNVFDHKTCECWLSIKMESQNSIRTAPHHLRGPNNDSDYFYDFSFSHFYAYFESDVI